MGIVDRNVLYVFGSERWDVAAEHSQHAPSLQREICPDNFHVRCRTDRCAGVCFNKKRDFYRVRML